MKAIAIFVYFIFRCRPTTSWIINSIHKSEYRLRSHSSSHLKMAVLGISNPLKKLPWNVRKENEREERRLKVESSKLYRKLGIPADATFEEIQEATQNLLASCDDIKERVKIEIIKDKILQLRLNQRLGGLLKESKEARATGYLQEDAIKYEKRGKEWEPPAWTRGLIVKPNEQWRDTCVIFYGTIAALGFFLPTAANGLQFFSFILCAGLMAQRGAPKAEPGMGMSFGDRVGSHTFLAFGLAFVIFVLTSAFTNAFLKSIYSIANNPIADSIQTIIVSTSMGLATAFLQPYRSDGAKSTKKGK